MTAKSDLHRDPITGTPAAHPLGTTLGASGGAMVGATAGAAWLRADSRAAPDRDQQDLIVVLNELIETCRDGESAFAACAQYLDAGALKRRYLQRVAHYRNATQELGTQVLRLGGLPNQGGTVRGAARRAWVVLRGSLSQQREQAMLEECERGENATLTRYRRALQKALPRDIRALVTQHMHSVRKSHDDMRLLCEQARSQA